MKLKVGILAAVAVLFGATAFAATQGSDRDRVTGGGQINVDTDGGAGDTIAFVIQGAGEDVIGQFQHVDRSGGTGQGGDSWHGSPACLEVAGNMAKAVIERTDNGELFELIIVDNGQGAAAENDIVALTQDDDISCGDDDDDDEADTELGRGNIQVYDAP
jgi:hypothetical protein